MTPPTDDVLRAFDAGMLPPEEIDAVTRWLESHPEAEERLRRLEQNDSAVEALRQPCSLSDELSELSDLTARVVDRVLSGSAGPSATAPQQIRDYQVLRPLGKGGMGSVYLARHTRLQRDVALKFLLGHIASDPDYRKRFEREMAVVGQLDHPHLIRAYDAGAEGAHLFLAMELLDGQDLARLVAQLGPLSLPDACEAIRQAALGLHHAHEHGLIHRDVKPANLFLTRSGVVKVIDLGLARVMDDTLRGAGVSTAETVLGTPECMAPEQWDRAVVDRRADLYALGCALFVLLTGRPPFTPANPDSWVAWMDAHRWEAPAELRQRLPDAPAELAALIAALLAKDPQKRPATALEVAERLAPFCGDLRNLRWESETQISQMKADCFRENPRNLRFRSKRGLRKLALILVLTIVLAAVAVASIWYFTRPEQTPPQNQPQGKLTDAAPSLLLTGQGHIELKNTAGMIDLNGTFTVEMWVKFGKGVQYFVGDEAWALSSDSSVRAKITRAHGWVLRIEDERMNINLADARKNDWVGFGGPPIKFDDEWHHIAVSSGGKRLTVFLDGSSYLNLDTSARRFVNCPLNLFLGPNNVNGRVLNDCAFRAFRVCNRQLYDGPFTPPREFSKTEDTLVLLDFSAAQKQIIPDRSGAGHDGLLSGGRLVWLTPPQEARPGNQRPPIPAKAAPSLLLTGQDHVELKDTAGMIDLNGTFTVEMWVKFDRGIQYFVGDESWPPVRGNRAVGQPGVKRTTGWVLRIHLDQRLSFTAAEATREWFEASGPVLKFDDQWHHLAVSKDRKVLRVFLDGKLYFSRSTEGITFINCPSNLFVGVRANAHDIRTVNCSYKAFRITSNQLYDRDFTPPAEFSNTANTLVLLDFSAGRGRVLRDLSGKGHDGLFSGGQWLPSAAHQEN